jgi:phosphomannomutase
MRVVIRFGPVGWRGIAADEVTFAAVRRVAAAAARHVNATGGQKRGIFVGHDARFLSARLAEEAASAIAEEGVPVFLGSLPLPAPVAAYAVVSGRRSLGLMIGGGASAPEVVGVMALAPSGGPAAPATTAAIEALAAAGPATPARPPPRRGSRALVRPLDPGPAYLRHLRSTARRLGARRARIRLACDPRHGAACGFIEAALNLVARPAEVLHPAAHPEFRGTGPDCGAEQLRDLARAVRRGRLDAGLATDGDAGRFGVIDRGGVHLPPNPVLALLADWLLGERGLPGGLARTVATTHLIDDVAAFHGRELVETRVGFAHLAPHLADGRVAVCCEETGALAVASHMPQRDGLLAAVLVAGLLAARRRPLRDQIASLFARVGARHGRRIDYHVDAAARDRMVRRLEDPPATIAGRRVREIDAPDGVRLTFIDGSWILVRASAVEPVVRCHIEARTPRDLEALTAAVREIVGRA